MRSPDSEINQHLSPKASRHWNIGLVAQLAPVDEFLDVVPERATNRKPLHERQIRSANAGLGHPHHRSRKLLDIPGLKPHGKRPFVLFHTKGLADISDDLPAFLGSPQVNMDVEEVSSS